MKNTIVLVPFPFDDFSATKVRPALCLTNEIGDYNHIVIAFISSKIETQTLNSDIILKCDANENFGLQVDSILKLHKLVTILKSLIKRKLGFLSNEKSTIVEEKLMQLFELKYKKQK
jgi:mRNA interferase MazF